MSQKILHIGAMLLCVGALSLCTKVDYNNPVDSKGTAWISDSAAAVNGNGVAAYYDPSSTWYRNHKSEILKQSTPVITFSGAVTSKGSDTVIVAQNDPNRVLSSLKVTASDPTYGDLTDSLTFVGDFYTSVCSTYVRTYTVTNPAGDSVHKPLYIVVDCSSPVLTLNGNNPMTVALGTSYAEPGATATDALDGTITSKIITTPKTINTSLVGSDTVTYTVTDRAGNKSTAQRVVNVFKAAVVDTTPPVITLVGATPMNLSVGGVYSEPGATATDNHDGNVTGNIKITGSVNTASAGTYLILYSVSDSAGNTASKTRIVNVTGNVVPPDSLPVITLSPPNPDTILVGSTYQDPGGTVADKKDGNIPFSSVTITGVTGKPVTVVTTLPGVTYTLVYNVKDKAGNAANPVTRTVVIVGVAIPDTTKPIITLGGHSADTVLMGATFTDTSATAIDDIDGNITAKIKAILTNSSGTVEALTTFTSTAGSYKITYTVSDAAGNTATAIRSILVQDTTGLGANLKAKYGVPLATALPSLQSTTYKTITAEGIGAPSIATIRDFNFAWRNVSPPTVDNFALDLTVNPYYLDLKSKITQTFSQASPGFILTGSGVAGLDGSYYIAASTTQCVWVKTDGSFAIIFKP